MTDTLHIVCPHCHTTNRVKTADQTKAPDCGSCHKPMFTAHSTALDEPAFDRHVQRNQIPVLVDFGHPGADPAARWRRPLSRQRRSWSRLCGWPRWTRKRCKTWVRGTTFAAFLRWRCLWVGKKWRGRRARWGLLILCVGRGHICLLDGRLPGGWAAERFAPCPPPAVRAPPLPAQNPQPPHLQVAL